jgi:GntR family transcriptional regulator/MocR family aminotransferase
VLAESPRIDLRGGQVDRATLPTAELKRAYSRVVGHAESLCDSFKPQGWLPLRRAIARSLVARGLACETEEVMIVSGAQQALDLVARTLVDPGDTVAIEQPGYFGAAAAFSAAEAHLVGVGVDERGLCTDELARLVRARRVKLLYTTPAVQSPTGVALSEARRRALLALADAEQLPIIEDDYDSELRYGTPPVPALKHLDRAGQVIYLGTFSKALFMGLRVGYVVASPRLLARMALMRWASDFHSNIVTQAAIVDLLESGALERHVRRVRVLYGERRDALRQALETHMPEGTHVTPPAGGNALWVRLPDATDVDALHAAACAAGIAYGRGESFALHDGPFVADAKRHLLLGFARLASDRIEPAVEELAQLVSAAGRPPRRRSA